MRTNKILLSAFFFILFISVSYAQAFGTIGSFTAKTNGPRIDINYYPSCYSTCTRIMLIQTICRKVYLKGDGWMSFMPSDATAAWTDKDPSTVNGCTVDYINDPVEPAKSEKDPYYNGDDPQDGGDKGLSTGSGDPADTKNATLVDSPRYNAKALSWLQNKFGNPVGKAVDKIVLEFEDCAFCADGKDKGQTYGCLKWKYEQSGNGPGVSTKGGTSGDPSADYTNAVNAWAAANSFNLPKSG